MIDFNNLNYVNYHKHSYWTNAIISDSVETMENYAIMAKNLGQSVISTVEHGYFGYYVDAYEQAKKYNLKMLYGAEAYWVKDRLAYYDENGNVTTEEIGKKDGTNNHIILLARTEKGRRAINKILSQSAKDGFYKRTRIDLNQISTLPPEDVFVTSACIAFNGYGISESKKIITDLHNYFGDNFLIELQYHNTLSQIKWNTFLLDLANKESIKTVMGCDSHYIYEEDSWKRTDFIKSKGLEYPDEEGWYMDYPTVEEAFKRFQTQGVLSDADIYNTINNTNIFSDIEEYNGTIFSTDIKMPTLYPELSEKDKNMKLAKLVAEKWNETKQTVDKNKWPHYESEIKRELKTIFEVNHADYFLSYYEGVKRGKELGGVATPTGRGSAVGCYCNKLLGLTKVDRIDSPVPLFFERFMSKSRMLEAKTLADIDENIDNRDIFIQAFTELFHEEHCVPMVAFGTLKAKAAWQMYAKAANIPFETANIISHRIADYEEYIKFHQNEDSEDYKTVYDFIGEEYKNIFDKSSEYRGIISDWKIAPSAVLIYSGNIEEELGLIRCKGNICCIVDKVWGDDRKFLKLDLLKVSSIELIYRVFNRLGISNDNVPDTNELIKLTSEDKKSWDIYANGYTMGINQVEQPGAVKKVMSYKPNNISELSAFIAAIRPGFKSMYNTFESRKPFDYGIKALDDLIQTKDMPYSFILYQENIMQVLSYSNIPLDQTYEIVKAISKKKKEKIIKHKSQFEEGFIKRLMSEEGYNKEEAQEISDKVWKIIEDSSSYSFNSAHAYSMAFDSLYGAYLKSHYPLEFYEVFLNLLMERNEKDRGDLVRAEAKKAFGIQVDPLRFRQDNRKFTLNKETNSLSDCLKSLKSFGDNVAEDLYKLKDNKYNNVIELFDDLSSTSINKTQIDNLILLNYFEEFGKNKKLQSFYMYYQKLRNATIIKKADIGGKIPLEEYVVKKFSENETEKQYRKLDNIGLLNYIWNLIPDESYIPKLQCIKEKHAFDILKSTFETVPKDWFFVDEVYGYNKNKPNVRLYNLNTGIMITAKIKNNSYVEQPFVENNIIRMVGFKKANKNKLVNGVWITTGEKELVIENFDLLA